jgi:hypothetical protein
MACSRAAFTSTKLQLTFVKEEKGDLLAEPHKILYRCKNYFGQLLNVQGAVDVRQTEIQTAEPFVSEPSASEVEVATVKLKNDKSPGGDQILVRVGGTLHSEIHKLVKLMRNRELPHQCKESIVIPIHKKGNRND